MYMLCVESGSGVLCTVTYPHKCNGAMDNIVMMKLGAGEDVLKHTGGVVNYRFEDMKDYNSDPTFYYLCLAINYTVSTHLQASHVSYLIVSCLYCTKCADARMILSHPALLLLPSGC